MTRTSFGRYEIKAELGRGGMATVYHAFDPRFRRDVALKILPLEFLHDQTFRERFERESQVIALLEHPAIVPVYDYGEEEGQTFYVMRYMRGGSLSDLIQRGPLPLDRAVEIVDRIAEALDFAHQKAIVHRDVKPANILFDEPGFPYLSDFGIVKLAGATMQLTGSGIVGTPAYMAPEMAHKEGVTPLIDIYALGVTLYQMLAGRLPFEAETPLGVLMAHSSQAVPDILDLRPDLPSGVQAVIEKALAKDPTARYQSACALADDLRAVQDGVVIERPSQPAATLIEPLPAAPPTPPAQPTPPPIQAAQPAVQRQPRRFPVWLLAGGGLVGIGMIAVVGIVMFALLSANGRNGSDDNEGGTTPESGEGALGADEGTAADLDATASPMGKAEVTAEMTQPASETPEPTATPQPQAGEERVNPTDGATLIYIPAGAFTMGLTSAQANTLATICDDCSPDSFGPSQPTRQVTVDAYWIYQTEVTNGMYQQCVAAGACSPPAQASSETRGSFYGNPAFDRYPVAYVDWYAADSYCRWAGGRLPSEAEWEKAGRGTDGRLFPWGDSLPDRSRANLNREIGDTTEAGAFPQGASPYGLYDMSGNVWEWVADWYWIDYDPALSSQMPPGDNPLRSLRGGSYGYAGGFASPGYRDWWEPYQTGNGVGFRCALDVGP